jgi:hypothetical protein
MQSVASQRPMARRGVSFGIVIQLSSRNLQVVWPATMVRNPEQYERDSVMLPNGFITHHPFEMRGDSMRKV